MFECFQYSLATDNISCIHLKMEHISAHKHTSHGLTYIIFTVHTYACVIKPTRMKLKGHVACLGKKRNYIQDFVVKPEGNRPLGRCRKGGKIIKMDLKEICEGMYSIDLA